MHTDSYWAPVVKCQFTSASADAVHLPGGEDDFGCYKTANPVQKCVSSDDSTTQWWFGVRYLALCLTLLRPKSVYAKCDPGRSLYNLKRARDTGSKIPHNNVLIISNI